jgi:hypothetical protein
MVTNNKIEKLWPRVTYLVLLSLIYAIAASQTIWSFSYKWTTVIDEPRISIERTLAGDTPKPYAYRLLMPTVVQYAEAMLPKELGAVLEERSQQTLERTVPGSKPLDGKLTRSYGIVLIMDFIMFLATLFLLRIAARVFLPNLQRPRIIRDISPLLFALLLSISYRVYNGFIYDFSELFLLTGYLVAVKCSRKFLALTLLALGCLNKETAILFPVFGALIRWDQNGWTSSHKIFTAMELVAASAVFAFVRIWCSEQDGGTVEWHFLGNLKFWFSYLPWVSVTTHHLPLILLPKPSNLLVAIPLLVCIVAYWPEKPRVLRRLFAAATILNFPLFVLFSYRDEFRNLSLMYPFLFLAAVQTIGKFYRD